MNLDQYDDSQSDSGVSADFSLNSMSDNETPIEKEIRLAFKREQSLRRSRGLDNTKEFIEIPLRKSVLSQDPPDKVQKDHSKERQFAGKKMQREIYAEAEREKVLVKLGRLPGFYDKGTVRQLQEKKLLFEAFQESKDLQISSDGTQESLNSMEILFQNHSSIQPTETSPKGHQNSKNQDHETFRTVQELKNRGTSSGSSCKILDGGYRDSSSKENTRHMGPNSPQFFPSLKEKKLLFESLQENKDLQSSRDQDTDVSGSFKAQRKSMDIFFQNQTSGLKTTQEPKDLQIKRNQDDKMLEISKEPAMNPGKVQNPKLCGPGFSEAVEQQVIIIENNPTVVSHTNRQVYKPVTAMDLRTIKSSPEELHHNSVQNPIANSEELKENPFFKLRSSLSLLPDMQKDIQEAKKREEELHKQRMCLYGNRSKVTVSPSRTTSTHSNTNTPGQNLNTSPVSSSFGKLDLTWPPPSLQNRHKTQPEVKEQRQMNLLVQRWESGLINGHTKDHHN
ncbi:uncharacterized protein misp3 [Hemibagrus wyckioides]|uniref:uncharacterized protein misp3 n=1 Tax=Hemibagrus wyckioides TaxID=337641 RepID=UPI00266C6C76|nr:uncharacterized protein misp3 [Hemibagrus wyckioides]